jgi:hypothetical protein
MTTSVIPEDALNSEIEAYEAMRTELESKHTGEWVLVQNRKLISLHSTFEKAAEEAVRRFGRGPHLIRQVGAPPFSLPASVMYNASYG